MRLEERSFQSTPREIIVLMLPSTLTTFGKAREVAGMMESIHHSSMAARKESSTQVLAGIRSARLPCLVFFSIGILFSLCSRSVNRLMMGSL